MSDKLLELFQLTNHNEMEVDHATITKKTIDFFWILFFRKKEKKTKKNDYLMNDSMTNKCRSISILFNM